MAIQLVELSAFRSLPILAYCNSSGVSITLIDPEKEKKSEASFDMIHQHGSKQPRLAHSTPSNHPDTRALETTMSVQNTKSNTYCRHSEKLVKGTQEDANAYGRQQDVQPLGHLGDAFPRDLVASIPRREALYTSFAG